MENYVYIILDVTNKGRWIYKDKIFDYKPIYVGIGVGRRYQEHFRKNIKKGDTNYTKFYLIQNLIQSGNKPICIKIYENIDRLTAINIEIDIIKHFGKLIDNTGILTNISNGGEDSPCNRLGAANIHSKKIYQYDIDGKFIKEWNGLRETGRILNTNSTKIGDCCRGKSKTSNGYQWFYEFRGYKIESVEPNAHESIRKKVYKYNIEGKLIYEYVSLTNASKCNNITKNNLFTSIKIERPYKGFYYSYKSDFIIQTKNRKLPFHKIEYYKIYQTCQNNVNWV